MKPEDHADSSGVIDLTSDIEPDTASSPSRPNPKRPPKSSLSTTTDADVMDMDEDAPSRPPSSVTEVDDDDFDIDALMNDEEEKLAKMWAASSAATSSSTSAPANVSGPAPQAQATYNDAVADDDEAAMWDELNGLGGGSYPPPSPLPPAVRVQVPPDEDEDIWDVVRGINSGKDGVEERPYIPPPPPPLPLSVSESEPAPTTVNGIGGGDSNTVGEVAGNDKEVASEEKKGTNDDDDWEDMYL